MNKTVVELARDKRWEEIPLTDNLSLNEAVKLEEFALVEPIANNNYDLALRRATFGMKWSIVPLLIPHVENINSMSLNQKGQTSLHFAARYGNDEVVRLLLQNGAYPNIFDTENYDTPLHLACEFKHPSTAKVLVEFGALNLLNRQKKSPVGYCAAFNNETRVEFSEFIILSMCAEGAKNSLPPLPEKYAWLNRVVVEKNSLVIVSCHESKSKSPVINHPENESTQIASKIMSKTLEIVRHNKIHSISVGELISLEKKYNSAFSSAITPMLHRASKESYLVDITEAELQSLSALAEKMISLVELLNVEFEVIFKTSSQGAYFIKSKTAVASDTVVKLPAESYRLSTVGELLIYSDKIDQIIESNRTMNSFFAI